MVRRHPVVLLGHRVHLHEDAADGVVSSGTEVLIALALEPVRGDVAVGSVQAAPHLVLLPAEAEEAASGGGVGSRKAVAAHPHPERQIVSPADDSVPVLGNHPHAAQVVTQEVLHPGARCTSVPLDENVVSFHSLKSLLSGFSSSLHRFLILGPDLGIDARFCLFTPSCVHRFLISGPDLGIDAAPSLLQR